MSRAGHLGKNEEAGDEHMGRSGISFAGGIGLACKKMAYGVKSWGFGQDWMRRRWRNDKEWRFH